MSNSARIIKDNLFRAFVFFFAILSILPLILIIFQIVKNGISAINLKFFLSLPKPPGEPGGGILNSLVGTLMLVLLATVLSVPIGITTGIFLAEVRNRFTEFLRTLVNVLQGLPSIVIGILAYLWVVRPMGGFSAISGAVALAMMMLPVIIKTTEETIRLIPFSLKEASFSLGASYTRTIFKVVLPASAGGILSGIIIGTSRIVGETAPLLFTAFGNPFVNLNPVKPTDALPLLIFNYAMSPYEEWHKIAWGASLVLVIMVLGLNLLMKIAGKRWKTKF